MNACEFDQFLEECYEELQRKQFYLIAEFGIANCDKFEIDWQQGILKLKQNSVIKFIAQVTPIGSYSKKHSTWIWAWEHPSVSERLKYKSERIKELGRLTGIEMFKTQIFQTQEETAWEIAAMACHHLKAIGCYRAPAGMLWNFIALDDIKEI
jgi:hypothetical protein